MEKFVFYYQGTDGTKWFRCNNCGYLTRGKPQICPVCNDKKIIREDDKK